MNRFIVLPRTPVANFIVDVSRIVCVSGISTYQHDEHGKHVQVDGKLVPCQSPDQCDVSVDGYYEGDDDGGTGSIRVLMSPHDVMQCVAGVDIGRDWRIGTA